MLLDRLIRIFSSPFFFIKEFLKATGATLPVFFTLFLFIFLSGTALFLQEPKFSERVQTFLFLKSQGEKVHSEDSLDLSRNNQCPKKSESLSSSSNKNNIKWKRSLAFSFEIVFIPFKIPKEKPGTFLGRLLILLDHIMGLVFFGLVVFLVTEVTPRVAKYIRGVVNWKGK